MDLLKPFLQRIAQPIVLSFCISWIFFNWEIVIGLLWYDAKTLPHYGYLNYKELITSNANICKNYLYPLLIALAFPFIRFGLNWINTSVRTKEHDQLLKVTSTGKMSTLRFVELKKSYDDRLTKISEFIDSEAELHIKLNEALTLVDKTKTELNQLKLELSDKNQLKDQFDNLNFHNEKIKKLSTPNCLIGKYIYKIWYEHQHSISASTSNSIEKGLLYIELKNNKYYFTFSNDDKINFSVFIEDYFYNILKDNLIITFKSDNNNAENELSTSVLNTLTNDYFIIYGLSKGYKSIHLKDGYQLEFESTF